MQTSLWVCGSCTRPCNRDSIKAALTSSLPAKIGALLARPALRRFRDRITPTPAAPLLGLGGLVVKCHGGADARDFGRSVGLAVDLAASDLMSQIERNMTRLGVDFPAAQGGPA